MARTGQASTRLGRCRRSLENLRRWISSARVDLNPYQVDAVLLALRSPLSDELEVKERNMRFFDEEVRKLDHRQMTESKD